MRMLAAVALAATAMAACARPDVALIPQEELPADLYGTPTPARIASLPERGTVWLVRDGRLAPVPRRLPEAGSLPEALVRGLLLGPRGATRSAIPDDTRFIGVRVDGDGVATVDASEEFERSAPGEELALRVAQVVFTLTEAPQVVAVAFSIEGRTAGVIAGNRQVVTRPVTRDDYRRFEPES
jgi:hypothetical protein